MLVIAIFIAIPMCVWILTHDLFTMFKNPNSTEGRGLWASYIWTIITITSLTIFPLIIMVVIVFIYNH